MKTKEEELKLMTDKINSLFQRKEELKAELLRAFVLSIENDSISAVADSAIDEILNRMEDIESKINVIRRVLYKDKEFQKRMIERSSKEL